MEINGEKALPAPLERVWQALNDPDVLKQCIPGCEALEQSSASEYRLTIVAVVGPIRVRLPSKLTLKDVVPLSGYTMLFEGNGGAAGFGSGSAKVALRREEATTLLEYHAHAQVGGKLAQVGSRLVDGVARKLAEEFFSRFNAHLSQTSAAATPSQQAQ